MICVEDGEWRDVRRRVVLREDVRLCLWERYFWSLNELYMSNVVLRVFVFGGLIIIMKWF